MVEEPVAYKIRFVDDDGKPIAVSVRSKKEAQKEAKELVGSGQLEECVVVDDKGRFVWYVTEGVSDAYRSFGPLKRAVLFLDEWPAGREWRDVVGVGAPS